MKKVFAMSAVVLLLSVSACSNTFVVSKDGKGYFLGSSSHAIYAMLCESGDLRKVLSDARLPQELKDDLYRFNCTADRSGEKVRQIYASMTVEQRRNLRNAFSHNGYDINYLPC